MKVITLIVLSITILISQLVAADQWPLVVTAEPEWSIEYTDDGVHFFTLTRPEGENVLLMFSKWPASGGKEQIPGLIKRMADGFLDKEKNKVMSFIFKNEYEVEKLEGDEFSGEAAIFKGRFELFQTMFMVSDGDGIWNGQFSGSETMWVEAKIILENLRRPAKSLPTLSD